MQHREFVGGFGKVGQPAQRLRDFIFLEADCGQFLHERFRVRAGIGPVVSFVKINKDIKHGFYCKGKVFGGTSN
jgi:hypothetical protein